MNAELKQEEVQVERAQIPIGMFSKGPRLRMGDPARVFMPHPVKRVVILGMGHSLFDWVHECYGEVPLLADPETQIWSINYAGFAMHSHVCFNMHDLESSENTAHRTIFEGYKFLPHVKVVSIKAYDWLPNSYEYPLQEIMEDPYASVPYFTNSTSYLVAMAIACRAKEIRIYGCDFDYDERLLDVPRFERGRANMEFWLGRASAYGCSLTVAAHSSLLGMSEVKHSGRIPFYGYGLKQPQFELTEHNQPLLMGFDDPPPPEAEKILEPGKGPDEGLGA